MARLESVSVERLRDSLDAVDGHAATMRLVVGINYKHGVSQRDLAAWYGVSRTTIHNWLGRLERLDSEPLADVIYDEPRPGRPTKITPDQRERLESALQGPPSDHGIERAAWSPPLARRFISDEFGVDYSLRHVRTILADAGIDWDSSRSTDDGGDDRASGSCRRTGRE